MMFRTSEGIRLFYDQQGHGPDLVLIGGLCTHHGIWDAMMPNLQRHFRILRLDNRGSGQSDTPKTPFLIMHMAQDVLELMDYLGMPHAMMVGHSMGAAILQYLLIHHSVRIEKAVLCGAFAKLQVPALIHLETGNHLREQAVSDRLILETVIPWIFGRTWIGSPFRVKEILRQMGEDPWPPTPEGYKAQAHALSHFDVRGELFRIRTPTLVIAGRQDKLTPLLQSRVLHRNISRSALQILAKTGHLMQVEQPEALARCIIEWYLSRHEK